jgi:hypothetical protein
MHNFPLYIGISTGTTNATVITTTTGAPTTSSEMNNVFLSFYANKK